MKKIFLPLIGAVALFYSCSLHAQENKPVCDVDFVKIKDGRKAEALFFYENNWKAFREEALKKGYIRSYKLISFADETSTDFNLMLITEYKDSAQYLQKEQNFAPIMKQLSPQGPRLLNDLKPREFTNILYSKNGKTLFGGTN